MPKRPFVQPLLFLGACALGAGFFFGGYRLRGSADPSSRVTKFGPDRYVASRTQDTPAIPLGDFYAAMTDLLKKEYVEPIKDDQKLASGAVRGMIASLGDPRCVYMDKDEFQGFLKAREGSYEGIGVELSYEGKIVKPKAKDPNQETSDDPRAEILESRMPYLTVTLVVPGGPAEKAGVKVGDIVSGIDGHWVPDAAEIARFSQARRDFDAKKIPYSTVAKMLSELKTKIERALVPNKAKDRLMLGTSGSVKVVWKRNGAPRTTTIVKAPSRISPFAVKGGAYTMRFDREAAVRLSNALKGKSSVTLDLRDNVDGDYDSMKAVLAVLAPNGTYGAITTKKKESPMPLIVENGNARPPKIAIRVDGTTQGPAAILARALSSHRLATLVGGPVGSDLSVREVYRLPDGTGYTLVVGEYDPNAAGSKVAFKEDPS